MTLRIIGAGLPRTGTASLQVALELLLDGRCYHMLEVFERPADVAVWVREDFGVGDFGSAHVIPAESRALRR